MDNNKNRNEIEELSLGKLDNGGLEERFALQLRKVIDNIDDPNTDPEAKREVNIKITFKPIDDGRRIIRVSYLCEPKLATLNAPALTAEIGGNKNGELVMAPTPTLPFSSNENFKPRVVSIANGGQAQE